MTKRVFKMIGHEQRQRAAEFCWEIPTDYVVTFSEPTRSGEANAAMWVRLQAFSEQLEWPVNGRMTKLPPESWKDLLTAAYKRESAQIAMALDGAGVVMLGMRTSKMSQREISELIAFMDAVAVDRGVSIPEEQAA